MSKCDDLLQTNPTQEKMKFFMAVILRQEILQVCQTIHMLVSKAIKIVDCHYSISTILDFFAKEYDSEFSGSLNALYLYCNFIVTNYVHVSSTSNTTIM